MLRINPLKQRYKHRQPGRKAALKMCLATELPLDGSAQHRSLHRTINHSLFYFPLQHNMELLYWARQRMSICRDCMQHNLQRQEALQIECRRFERLFENIIPSSNQLLHNHYSHISFAVRTASSLTKWLSALCYRKWSRDMYPDEWDGKFVWSF